MLLKDVISAIIDAGWIKCDEGAVQTAIADGTWTQFDDLAVWNLIQKLAQEDTSLNGYKAQCLLDRKVPKLTLHFEKVDGLDRQEEFTLRHKAVLQAKEAACAEFGIEPSLWYLWYKPGITLTKVGSRVAVGAIQAGANPKDKDRYEQSVRILGDDGVSSTDIMSEQQSLMSLLSNNALYALRLYVLLPSGKEGLAPEITKYMLAKL